MTIDPCFLDLMPTTATLSRLTGADAFGNNTYSASEPIRCRVESLTKTVVVSTADGGTVLAEAGDSVSLITDYQTPVIAEGDRVQVQGRTMRVLSQTIEYDENGPYYQSCVCGNNQER